MDIQTITKAKETDPPPRGFPLPPKKPKLKRCIYYNDTECVVPTSWFEVCKTCPYGYFYCMGAIIKNIYGKIIGLAVNMFNRL